MLGKSSMQIPLEVYIEDGGYDGSIEEWREKVAHWFEFPRARELLQIFTAFGQL